MRRFGFALLAVVTAASTAQAGSLTTTFASTEIGGGGWTNLFNVSVTNPLGLTFTDVTINAVNGAGGSLDIYTRPLTYVGSENTFIGWTLASTTPFPGSGGPATLNIADFSLPAGTYGVALVNTSYQVAYTTGATDYSNADLAIDNGATVRGALAGQIDANKTWNGTLTYNVGVPEPTSLAALGLATAALLRRRRIGCHSVVLNAVSSYRPKTQR